MRDTSSSRDGAAAAERGAPSDRLHGARRHPNDADAAMPVAVHDRMDGSRSDAAAYDDAVAWARASARARRRGLH
jgi:hypothetical protein